MGRYLLEIRYSYDSLHTLPKSLGSYTSCCVGRPYLSPKGGSRLLAVRNLDSRCEFSGYTSPYTYVSGPISCLVHLDSCQACFPSALCIIDDPHIHLHYQKQA